MQIAVWANDAQWKELAIDNAAIEWIRMDAPDNFITGSAASFILSNVENYNFESYQQPIFIHAMDNTLKEMNAPRHVLRINGWNGFLQNEQWEIAGEINDTVKEILLLLCKKVIPLPDIPGFVSARIIAMIINEAYLAFEQDVSTKEAINIALKLGTNYPLGPFEWAEKIGIKNIYSLLLKLSIVDKRFLPATLLQKEATT